MFLLHLEDGSAGMISNEQLTLFQIRRSRERSCWSWYGVISRGVRGRLCKPEGPMRLLDRASIVALTSTAVRVAACLMDLSL